MTAYRGTKFHNKKTISGGNKFDSKLESWRYEQLRLMESAGVIEDLKRQVRFELIPSQRMDGKVVERAVSYIADFVYYENGELVVEDTKSKITRKLPEYIIKRKLMLYVHGIKVKEWPEDRK